MTTAITVYAVVTIAAILANRTFYVAGRARSVGTPLVEQGPVLVVMARSTLGFLSMLAMWALIAYGFVGFEWYVAGAVLLTGIIVSTLVTRRTFSAFWTLMPLLDIAAIAGAVWLWGEWL